jgi:hypothetical protein
LRGNDRRPVVVFIRNFNGISTKPISSLEALVYPVVEFFIKPLNFSFISSKFFNRSFIHMLLELSLLLVELLLDLTSLLYAIFFICDEISNHLMRARWDLQIIHWHFGVLAPDVDESKISLGSNIRGTEIPLAVATLSARSLTSSTKVSESSLSSSFSLVLFFGLGRGPCLAGDLVFCLCKELVMLVDSFCPLAEAVCYAPPNAIVAATVLWQVGVTDEGTEAFSATIRGGEALGAEDIGGEAFCAGIVGLEALGSVGFGLGLAAFFFSCL